MTNKELRAIKKIKSWRIDHIFVGNFGQITIKRDYFGKVESFRTRDARRVEIKNFSSIEAARAWLASF